jgi:hypothetical protein
MSIDTNLILGLVGLTIIISSGSIFDKPRGIIANRSKFLGELISCPMCLGFWVGLICAVLFGTNPIIVAGVVSLFSWCTYNVIDLISTASAYITNLIIIQGHMNGDGKNIDIKTDDNSLETE